MEVLCFKMTRLSIPIEERICFRCGSNITYIDKRTNRPVWLNVDGKPCCKKCICIIKYNPIINEKWKDKKKWHKRRLLFKDKRISLKENPRIGFCNICKKIIGEEYINYKGEKKIIKNTNMHHMKYNDKNPLADSLEVCAVCHAKITAKQIDIIIL